MQSWARLKSSRSMARSTRWCRSALERCSSGASATSAPRRSSSCASKACLFTSSPPMATRYRARARCQSFSSARASGSTRSRSDRNPANTRCAPFHSRTKPGKNRRRAASSRRSCVPDPAPRAHTRRPEFWTSASSIDEVRSARIARRRTLTYSTTAERKVFMIDGRVMEEDRVDQTVRLGDTEEWMIVNTDKQYHSFHIHQTAFLVTEVDGVRRNEASLRDTFSLPPATEARPGVLKVVIPFTDPVIVGRFVYHCHAVDHEDKGMMGVIEVVAPYGRK